MATSAHLSPGTAAIGRYEARGAAAGLVGGIGMGMGIWMSVSAPLMDTAMITMVAGLLGSADALAGWLIHLAIALFAGVGFGLFLGPFAQKLTPGIGLGLLYGAVWWVVGAARTS